MIRQYELVEKVKAYDPNADEDALNRAYVYAMKAHRLQKRASGDPYFSHPLEVANILTSLKLDTASIVTALLHDTVEDTEATISEIRDLFGDEIAKLVDGVTKLDKIKLQTVHTQQAENFRKLFLAMSDDIRVLLVKLADRLHNMRTINFVSKEEKRKRIAIETLEIYVPLAERIGVHEFKNELEELSFIQINGEAYESIIRRLRFLQKEDTEILIPEVIKELSDTLEKDGIKAKINGRQKTPYSIWRKMQRYNLAFEQLGDIMAFRIVVDDIGDCYKALGILHSTYTVLPGRFKDYISTAKPNGYSSIHTGLIGPKKQRIEVQIRTQQMHEINEWGVAAHWVYKHSESASTDQQYLKTSGKRFKWIRELLDILDNADNPQEFLEHTKLEMYSDQVFCFSPKGDLTPLPQGSTPVDFAYAVHSEIGNRCIGARINGRLLPLRTKLRNGDQIDIITSNNQQPSPSWEQFVVTGKAKAAIRRFVRNEQRDQFLKLGKTIINKAFKTIDKKYVEKELTNHLKSFNADTVDEIFIKAGEGQISFQHIVDVLTDKVDAKTSEEQLAASVIDKRPSKKFRHAIPIHGLIPGMAIHYARCCHPLPGDAIVGIVATGRGVTIHTEDCENLEQFKKSPERWLDVSWEDNGQDEVVKYIARFHIVIINQPGALGMLTSSIGKHEINISNLKFVNRTQDFFEILLDVEVVDTDHLHSVMGFLRSIPAVQSVERTKH